MMFFAESMNNANMSGAGNNLTLRFGGKAGIGIGLVSPGSQFYLSLDVARSGAKRIAEMGAASLWILFPTLSMEMIFIDGVDQFSFGAGITATGLRLTFCKPIPMVVDLRGVNVHIMSDMGRSSGTVAVPLGLSLEAGILF